MTERAGYEFFNNIYRLYKGTDHCTRAYDIGNRAVQFSVHLPVWRHQFRQRVILLIDLKFCLTCGRRLFKRKEWGLFFVNNIT